MGRVPVIAENNDNLSTAVYLPDISKSWAIYDRVGEGQAQYYSFDVDKGQRIYASLLIPTDPAVRDFSPSMALQGPGLMARISLPSYVEVPKNYGALIVNSSRAGAATYEAFGPSSYYELADIDISAPQNGSYYIAVYDGNREGRYGLAIGYLEEFTVWERVVTPVKLISVYLWEGQSLALILAPSVLAFLLGLLIALRNPRSSLFSTTALLAGFLLLGWSITVIIQMAFNLMRTSFSQDAYITLGLALLPAVLGVAAVKISRGEAGMIQRIVMIVLEAIALIIGSGLIIAHIPHEGFLKSQFSCQKNMTLFTKLCSSHITREIFRFIKNFIEYRKS